MYCDRWYSPLVVAIVVLQNQTFCTCTISFAGEPSSNDLVDWTGWNCVIAGALCNHWACMCPMTFFYD